MQRSVLEYLENSTQKFPDKTIFADGKNKISYREFQTMAKSVGTGLACNDKIGQNMPIVVFIERDIESLIGFFGVIYSGNFYVPVDTQMPAKRIELIFHTLNPAAVIVSEKTKRALEHLSYDGLILDLE